MNSYTGGRGAGIGSATEAELGEQHRGQDEEDIPLGRLVLAQKLAAQKRRNGEHQPSSSSPSSSSSSSSSSVSPSLSRASLPVSSSPPVASTAKQAPFASPPGASTWDGEEEFDLGDGGPPTPALDSASADRSPERPRGRPRLAVTHESRQKGPQEAMAAGYLSGAGRHDAARSVANRRANTTDIGTLAPHFPRAAILVQEGKRKAAEIQRQQISAEATRRPQTHLMPETRTVETTGELHCNGSGRTSIIGGHGLLPYWPDFGALRRQGSKISGPSSSFSSSSSSRIAGPSSSFSSSGQKQRARQMVQGNPKKSGSKETATKKAQRHKRKRELNERARQIAQGHWGRWEEQKKQEGQSRRDP